MSKGTFLLVKNGAPCQIPRKLFFFTSRSLLVSRPFSEGNGLTFNGDELLSLSLRMGLLCLGTRGSSDGKFWFISWLGNYPKFVCLSYLV